MAKTANIHVRLDETVKNEAIAVFDTLGIGVADAQPYYEEFLKS